MKLTINRSGFLAHHRHPTEVRRTYVCTDLEALFQLIERLTRRSRDTFTVSKLGIPRVPEVSINYGVHVYSTEDASGIDDSETNHYGGDLG